MPDLLVRQVQARQGKLRQILDELTERCEEVPMGSLRISDKGNVQQYYHRKNPKDKKGTYIKKKDRTLAIALAQKDYDLSMIRELKEEINAIEHFLKAYHPQHIDDLYEKMHINRRKLINPIQLPTEMYVERWRMLEYPRKAFAEDDPEFYSDAGERVRSKSEIIIANKLGSFGIPYRYEYPINISQWITYHPDFYCLNARTRREYAWEHFGMMDDSQYASSAVKKLEEYEKAGFWPGINLIVTFEASSRPLNVKVLDQLIRTYLL